MIHMMNFSRSVMSLVCSCQCLQILVIQKLHHPISEIFASKLRGFFSTEIDLIYFVWHWRTQVIYRILHPVMLNKT